MRAWSGLRPRTIVGALLALAGICLVWSTEVPAQERPATRVTFAGSGTNLAGARILAEAFRRVRPDIVIDIPSSIGSKGGIKAVAEGAIAVALTSRDLQGPETTLGLAVRAYARTAIVIAAHASVPDDGVTSREIIEIYRGNKTRWRDGQEIVVLTRS